MSTFTVDIPAGPLWNDADAKAKAPKIAAAHRGKWNNQWTTVVNGEMSVIGVELNTTNTGKNSFKTDVLAGPLWSDGGTFTGQWKTIVEGVMSVIQVEFKF